MQKSLWNIYKTFFKIGTLLLGGGYVILPLLQSEIVEKKNWATSEDIIEYYALSQSLPGLIAANISIFTGYKLLGYKGAFMAISGIITPAFLVIVLIANILNELVTKHFIRSIFLGVGIGVIILVLLTIKEMWNKSIIDNFTKFIFIISLVLAYFKISPFWIIIMSVVFGILYKTKFSKESDK